MKRLSILTLTFSIFATAAYAHNGMINIIGTVSSITDRSISVKTSDGKIQTMLFTTTTKFTKSDGSTTAKDTQVGVHVAIHATRKGDQLTADEVKSV